LLQLPAERTLSTPSTLTGREFNQETGKAKQYAEAGPIFITDRGRPSYVLLSIRDYRRLTGTNRNIADLLSLPGTEDIELESPRLPDLPNAPHRPMPPR
jgi:PHD/YefM family antitoxin component YafN of YafNO toxin-antitoxin module